MADLPKDVQGFHIGKDVIEKKSLVAIFNVAEKMMREAGMPEGAIVASRQQFFIGADAFHQILKCGHADGDRGLIAKLEKEIQENLIQPNRLDA